VTVQPVERPDTGAALERPDTGDPAAEMWQQLRALVLDHDRRRQVVEELDLSFVRIKALRRVAEDGPLTMRALAAALLVDAPYLTLVVDDLEHRGLLARTVHLEDRRVRLVTATTQGHQTARRAEELLGAPPAALRALSGPDQAELHRIITLMSGGASGRDSRPGDTRE
jgi:DNA-binding MarR family transcriptional regulator